MLPLSVMIAVWLLCKYFQVKETKVKSKAKGNPQEEKQALVISPVTMAALAFAYMSPTMQVWGGERRLSFLYSRHYDSHDQPNAHQNHTGAF